MSAFDARIAEALGWTSEEARSFSLAAMRDLVRPVNPALAAEISNAITTGAHVVMREPPATPRYHTCTPGNRTGCARCAANDVECAPRASTAPVADVTITPSAVKPANVEIRFAVKPDADVRAELKAAGFRWMGRDGCWYGPRASLPARFGGVS